MFEVIGVITFVVMIVAFRFMLRDFGQLEEPLPWADVEHDDDIDAL